MKEPKKTRWLVLMLSLFFALLFFYNANLSNIMKVESNFSVFSATATKVPINVTYNQEKYYITGYDQTVDVELTTANKILLDKESNNETRSFSVLMDLTKYSVGTHEVPLQLVGMPSAITGKIVPSKVTVTIENRASNTFEVEPSIDASIFASGSELDKATVTPDTVSLSGSEETISKVSRVIAGVSDKTDVTSDFSEKVKPYAIDEAGNVLDVVIEPETVRVDVSVKLPSKKVKIKPVQSGNIPQGVKDYTFSMKNDEVTITGSKKTIDEINSIELKVDTSNITETAGNSYQIVVPDGVTVDQDSIFITVIPEKSK